MNSKKDALKEQEAEMLKQFNVEELEERLEMSKWGGDGTNNGCGIGGGGQPNGNGCY